MFRRLGRDSSSFDGILVLVSFNQLLPFVFLYRTFIYDPALCMSNFIPLAYSLFSVTVRTTSFLCLSVRLYLWQLESAGTDLFDAPSFRNRTAFSKALRLRPLVLLVTATCRWTWVRNTRILFARIMYGTIYAPYWRLFDVCWLR